MIVEVTNITSGDISLRCLTVRYISHNLKIVNLYTCDILCGKV